MKQIILSTSILVALSGCAAPLVLFGAGAVAGTAISQEKTIGNSLDDSSIWSKIKLAFTQHKEIDGLLTQVSVEVSEGRVLLTGNVASAEDRLEVLKIVWEQNGVREVINELKIRDNENNYDLSKYAKDSWITTQIKSKMLVNSNVRSINYTIETVEKTVYIFGIARSEAELAEVKQIAQETSDVS